jgi:hypothetical protein
VAPAASSSAADARRRRAILGGRLISAAPEIVAALDWQALDRAPVWLGLPDAAFSAFQCRVGAVLWARSLRLWIDEPRLAAARACVGEPFLQRLRAEPDAASLPSGLVHHPGIASAAQVAPRLRAAGAGVLLASLPHGSLRMAAEGLLAPIEASTMARELAAALIERATAIAAQTGLAGAAAEVEARAA